MYTVQVKHITATEARKNWFRLLDEAAGGEVIIIDREGTRLVLHRQQSSEGEAAAKVPSYEGLIRVAHVEEADLWGWEWTGAEQGVVARTGERGS